MSNLQVAECEALFPDTRCVYLCKYRLAVRCIRRVFELVLPVRSISSRQRAADAVAMDTAEVDNVTPGYRCSYRSGLNVCSVFAV